MVGLCLCWDLTHMMFSFVLFAPEMHSMQMQSCNHTAQALDCLLLRPLSAHSGAACMAWLGVAVLWRSIGIAFGGKKSCVSLSVRCSN